MLFKPLQQDKIQGHSAPLLLWPNGNLLDITYLAQLMNHLGPILKARGHHMGYTFLGPGLGEQFETTMNNLKTTFEYSGIAWRLLGDLRDLGTSCGPLGDYFRALWGTSLEPLGV